MTTSPQFEAFRARFTAAQDAGLTAAAYLYRNAVAQKLRKGYTSGKYVTPYVALNVFIGELFTRDGVRVIKVGTDVQYALYWELGWMPAFGHQAYDPESGKRVHIQTAGPRRLLRREHWRETMDEQRAAMRAQFARTFLERLAKG